MKKEELKNLVDNIQSMTAKEIILSMVDALRNPVTEIHMTTFGVKINGICFGCASTNTICKLANIDPFDNLYMEMFRRYNLNNDIPLEATFWRFEQSIDFLRTGNIEGYNDQAERGGFATIKKYPEERLPWLHNDYTKRELQLYEDFANSL